MTDLDDVFEGRRIKAGFTKTGKREFLTGELKGAVEPDPRTLPLSGVPYDKMVIGMGNPIVITFIQGKIPFYEISVELNGLENTITLDELQGRILVEIEGKQ